MTAVWVSLAGTLLLVLGVVALIWRLGKLGGRQVPPIDVRRWCREVVTNWRGLEEVRPIAWPDPEVALAEFVVRQLGNRPDGGRVVAAILRQRARSRR